MRHIQLHGVLGQKFGEHWDLDVATPAEAFRAIDANKPGFIAHIIASGEQGVSYQVLLDERDLDVEGLHLPSGHEVIHLVPLVAGAKGGKGITGIILGAAMIAVGVMTGGASVGIMAAMDGAIAAGMVTTELMGAIAFSIGTNLVLGGVSQMLAGSPKQDNVGTPQAVEDKPSYYFNGPVNNMQQGNAVPIGYGQMIVGALPISAGVSTENIAI